MKNMDIKFTRDNTTNTGNTHTTNILKEHRKCSVKYFLDMKIGTNFSKTWLVRHFKLVFVGCLLR